MIWTVVAWVSFSSLSMLAWATAVLIPVVIHLLRRRRKVAVPWAAMNMLREIVEKESRRVNLQQILLLMLRVAILLVFALALSRPYFNQTPDVASGISLRPFKVLIFVIDTSYSMGYKSGELTRMERAKQLAARMVRESQPGDAFSLIALDQPSRAIVSMPTFDSQAILKEIQTLNDNALGCDAESALSIAGQIVTAVRNNPQLPQVVEVVVLTDLGEDAWRTASDGPVQLLLQRLQQSARVTVESIVDSKTSNVVVELVQPMQKRLTVGSPVTVEVSIATYGQPVVGMPVELVWNDQIISTKSVEIDAGDRTKIPMTFVPARPGPGILSIVTPADNLPIDNRFDMVLNIRPRLRVLIIDSDTSSLNPWLLALQPDPKQRDLGVQADVRVVSEMQWLSSRDTDWDVIVANDVQLGDMRSLNQFTSFVQSGGCLIVTLGKNKTAYQSEVGTFNNDNSRDFEELLGYRITRPSNVEDWTIDPLGYQSPVIKVFEGYPNSGLLTTPVYRFWQIEQQDPSLHVDLAVTTGQPLIVHRRLGNGYVVSMLSAPEDGRGIGGVASWNAMTTWPSFLPLSQQMVEVFFDNQIEHNNKFAGQLLTGRLQSPSPSRQVKLIRPDGIETQLTLRNSEDGDESEWAYEATDQRGIYQVELADDERHIVAVNIDPVQSSLNRVDVDSLRIIPRPDSLLSAAEQLKEAGLTKPAQDQYIQTHKWARILLMFLGILLVVESLTAWGMGRQIG